MMAPVSSYDNSTAGRVAEKAWVCTGYEEERCCLELSRMTWVFSGI